MVIKLWFVKRGEFCKEIEMPTTLLLSQRLTVRMYGPTPEMKGDWVFVRVSESEYEFSHVEDVK